MGKTFTPRQQNWKWYENNAAEPTVQLANEITKPTLTDAAIIRLRLCIIETGDITGSGALSLEYSTNDADFTAFGAGNHWNYADGLATESGTITGNLLSDANVLGTYHESGTATATWAKSNILELDIAIQPTGTVSGNTTYYFRASVAGTEVPLNTLETHPQVLTAAGAGPPGHSPNRTAPR